MEAHEGALRAIALTADGSKLATASVRGTVIRVWDVAFSTCMQEFRRGVERATVTCLNWSWDSSWLACSSDKGTTHIFQLAADDATTEKKEESYTQKLWGSVVKSMDGDAKKSVCQVRGVPHPQACAFVAEASNLIAVAGWDADGNGVLLLSEFTANQEPRRVGYHVLCKTSTPLESEEARRRRRLRGWTPEIPQTPEGGRLLMGERLDILERGMEQIYFEEKDEFVSVTAIRPEEQDAPNENGDTKQTQVRSDLEESQNTLDEARSSRADSVRTEPLDDFGEQSGTTSSL
jgi:hypothetical protein